MHRNSLKHAIFYVTLESYFKGYFLARKYIIAPSANPTALQYCQKGHMWKSQTVGLRIQYIYTL